MAIEYGICMYYSIGRDSEPSELRCDRVSGSNMFFSCRSWVPRLELLRFRFADAGLRVSMQTTLLLDDLSSPFSLHEATCS